MFKLVLGCSAFFSPRLSLVCCDFSLLQVEGVLRSLLAPILLAFQNKKETAQANQRVCEWVP